MIFAENREIWKISDYNNASLHHVAVAIGLSFLIDPPLGQVIASIANFETHLIFLL